MYKCEFFRHNISVKSQTNNEIKGQITLKVNIKDVIFNTSTISLMRVLISIMCLLVHQRSIILVSCEAINKINKVQIYYSIFCSLMRSKQWRYYIYYINLSSLNSLERID